MTLLLKMASVWTTIHPGENNILNIRQIYFYNKMERLLNPPPPINALKRVFFKVGGNIEKRGMVFWGQSNKEDFFLLVFL